MIKYYQIDIKKPAKPSKGFRLITSPKLQFKNLLSCNTNIKINFAKKNYYETPLKFYNPYLNDKKEDKSSQ
jgi:hypothetical protein